MIHLLFVGDGRRDDVSVPRLVETILGAEVREDTRTWGRFHRDTAGRGYRRKLLYAFRQARDVRAEGLVATLDADKAPRGERLNKLRDGRDAERKRSGALPAALGEAVPHGEAWLLDDATAVREGLGLAGDVRFPSVVQTENPKRTLEGLLKESPRAGERPVEVWGDIARHVQPSRCRHSKKTGFENFVAEVRTELGSIVPPPRDGT